MAQYKGAKALNNNVISKIVASMWKQEAPEVKAFYAAKADEEKRIHLLKYPDYKYRPRKASKAKIPVIKTNLQQVTGLVPIPRSPNTPLLASHHLTMPMGESAYSSPSTGTPWTGDYSFGQGQFDSIYYGVQNGTYGERLPFEHIPSEQTYGNVSYWQAAVPSHGVWDLEQKPLGSSSSDSIQNPSSH